MLKQPLYLVPYDFTPVSESALRLAIDLAEVNSGSVYLLHIVKKNSEKKTARQEFVEVVEKLKDSEKELITTSVIVGDLFEDMSKAGEILKARLVVMGTHGAQGMQKIFGSNAIKMISNSATPFLITQGKKSIDKIKTIVMPFSFAKETIQIATFAGSIAKKFNATIHLVGFHDKDEWLGSHTKGNQLIVSQLLSKNNVAYEIVNLPKQNSYETELMDYALSVDADIIAAAYFKEGIMPSPNSFIQVMLENEHQIPVLTVSSEELTSINSNISFLTV